MLERIGFWEDRILNKGDNMQGIRHTGIYVKDLESMISFYQDVFDLRIAVRQKEYGDYTDTIFNEKNVEIDVCKLEFSNKTMIELVHYAREEDSLRWNEKIHQCGKMHIAITVESIEKVYEKIKERGCQVLSKPCNSPDGKVKVFFARDLEGNYLELVEEQNIIT